MDISERLNVIAGQVNRHPWEIVRKEVIFNLFKQYCTTIISTDKECILDIGCGDAYIARSFSTRIPGIRVIGIDPHWETLSCHKSFKPPPFNNLFIFSSLASADLKDGSVGIVFLLDVLEHVKNDKHFLKKIVYSKGIKKDAVFLITVPAFQGLYSDHDSGLGHYRRYNGEDLYDLALVSGLQPVSYGYFFHSLFILRLLGILFNKIGGRIKKNEFKVFSWNGSKGLTRFLRTLLLIDYHFGQIVQKFNFKLPGLSCFLIGRKQEL